MSVWCGIDIGTSGVKAALVDEDLRLLAQAGVAIRPSTPVVGASEQDPADWIDATFECLDQLKVQAPGPLAAVRGIGLSGQMLSALVLDDKLVPLRPAMLWNDQRALRECTELLARMPDIGRRGNGAPDPGITAPKLLWLRRHEPQRLERARMLLLAKDYVRLALTGEIASEPTDAGGTLLFDVRRGAWDAAMCAAAEWPSDALPPILQPWDGGGWVRPALAARWGFVHAVPVAAGAGDNMATTLGAGAARPGDCVITLGTSGVACAVDAAFRPGPQHALLTSAHAAPDAFLSMGVVMSATQALDWTARLTGHSAASLADAALSVLDDGRAPSAPTFLPCLSGIRTPLNRPDASARIDGLHGGVDAAQLGYAVIEGVALQIALCVEAQAKCGILSQRFVAVGGGARSRAWLRLLAALLDAPIELSDQAPHSATNGAARLAMVASGADRRLLTAPLAHDHLIEPEPGIQALLRRRRERFDALLPSAAA